MISVRADSVRTAAIVSRAATIVRAATTNARKLDDVRGERRERKEGNRTVIQEGNRTIVREGNRTFIRRDESIGCAGSVATSMSSASATKPAPWWSARTASAS